MNNNELDRRGFIKKTALAAGALGLSSSVVSSQTLYLYVTGSKAVLIDEKKTLFQ